MERQCEAQNQLDRRSGGAQPGNRFVSFGRAYARSGCLVELDLKLCWLPFYRFPFGLGELSLSPFAMEAPWKLVEARLCTGLQRFCIVKTMDFATSHMPWRLHGGSWRPVSVRASNAFALQKQWILQHLICHGGSMEARGGLSLYEPPPLLHCKKIEKRAFCTIEALRDSGLYNIKLGSPRASTDRRGCQPRHLEF